MRVWQGYSVQLYKDLCTVRNWERKMAEGDLGERRAVQKPPEVRLVV